MTSEQCDQVLAALNRIQAILLKPKKRTFNSFFKSKYADIGSVMSTVHQPLRDNGLLLTQPTEVVNDQLLVVTRIYHVESGQWVQSVYPCPISSNPQDTAKQVTYGRRISIGCILALVNEDEDNDGNQPDKKTDDKFERTKTWIMESSTKSKLDATKKKLAATEHGFTPAQVSELTDLIVERYAALA